MDGRILLRRRIILALACTILWDGIWQRAFLLMTEYDTDKTADKIRNFFDFQLEKYNITEEMRSRAVVVSDAASNMVRAFKAFDKSETMER